MAGRWRTAGLLATLGSLTALAPFTIDTYLPALPQIAAAFQSTAGGAQRTLAATIIGFALGQLVAGPWSDRKGRRTPLTIGLIVHVASCAAAATAPTLLIFEMARVFQGVGASAGTAVTLAVVRDMYSGQRLIRALGQIALISGVAPLVAPNLGAYLGGTVGWRAIFVFLAGYGLLMVAATWTLLGETRGAPTVRAAKGWLTAYRSLLRHRSFQGVLVIGGMRFTALFAYLQASPFILQIDRGLSGSAYGLILAANSLGMFAGIQLSTRIARRIAPPTILAGSLVTLTASGAAVTIAGLSVAPAAIIVVSLFGLMLGCGFGLPMIQAIGLDDHPDAAGGAAALIGASSFGMAGALAPMVALPVHWGLDQTASLGVTILITSGVSLVAWVALLRKPQPGTTPDQREAGRRRRVPR